MSTSGAGSRENRVRYAALDSCAHHCQSSTSPVCPSMAMIRHQPWPMYVPSAMTVWRLASGGAMRGRMRQHHAIRLRRARASPAESAALWDDGPSSQERNSSSVRSRLRRRCGIVELNRQAGHFHRWTPLPVRPFFFIARPHTGHLFALLDGVLTPSSPPPGAHHFPRDKNDRPTRLLPQGRATVISTTKVPIGRKGGAVNITKTKEYALAQAHAAALLYHERLEGRSIKNHCEDDLTLAIVWDSGNFAHLCGLDYYLDDSKRCRLPPRKLYEDLLRGRRISPKRVSPLGCRS